MGRSLTALFAYIGCNSRLHIDGLHIRGTNHITFGRVSDLFLRHNAIDLCKVDIPFKILYSIYVLEFIGFTCEYILECGFNVRRVEGRGFYETQTVALRKQFRLIRRHRTQVPQIGLVAHQHNDNVLVGMIAQLSQPPLHILVRQMLGNIVDEQCADSTTIICRGNGPITLLSGRIPYLRLNCFTIDLGR